jgi:hypothetical protein
MKSKTMWVNALTVGSMVLSGGLGIPLPVDPRTAGIALGIINMGLRCLTSKPLSEK